MEVPWPSRGLELAFAGLANRDGVVSRCSATGSVLGDGRPANCTGQSGRSATPSFPQQSKLAPQMARLRNVGRGRAAPAWQMMRLSEEGTRQNRVAMILSLLISGVNSIFPLLFLVHLLHAGHHHHHLYALFPCRSPPVSMSWLRHGWRPTITASSESDWTMPLAYASMVAGA